MVADHRRCGCKQKTPLDVFGYIVCQRCMGYIMCILCKESMSTDVFGKHVVCRECAEKAISMYLGHVSLTTFDSTMYYI